MITESKYKIITKYKIMSHHCIGPKGIRIKPDYVQRLNLDERSAIMIISNM